jgi:hypothetical protein
LLLLETTFGFTKITYLMAYCIYTGASVLVQDVKTGDLDARSKINRFLRALKGGLKTCPIVQRSIDIINNGLKGGGQSKTIDDNESASDQIGRNYLPAFPYGDSQLDISNENNFSFSDSDTFALLDSFPDHHIDTTTGEWYLS